MTNVDDETTPAPLGTQPDSSAAPTELPLYLDANAFDSILDDAESDRVVDALKAKFRVLVSGPNLAELVPKNAQRGERLRNLALSLMTDNRLLDDPREVLSRCLLQDRLGSDRIDVSIPYTAESIAPVLADPAHEEVVAKQRMQNIEIRKAGKDLVKSLREIPSLLNPDEWARIRKLTCQEFIRQIIADDDRIHDWCGGILTAAGAVPYQVRQAPTIVRRLAPWRTFLAAQAATIYFNGVQRLPKVLGYSDMFQAVNLAWVEVFVTDDNAFRVLAGEVARAALPGEKRRTLTYADLRAELLPAADSVALQPPGTPGPRPTES